MKPSTCNVYIRGLNSFLSWLHEYEFITEPLKIKLLKTIQYKYRGLLKLAESGTELRILRNNSFVEYVKQVAFPVT